MALSAGAGRGRGRGRLHGPAHGPALRQPRVCASTVRARPVSGCLPLAWVSPRLHMWGAPFSGCPFCSSVPPRFVGTPRYFECTIGFGIPLLFLGAAPCFWVHPFALGALPFFGCPSFSWVHPLFLTAHPSFWVHPFALGAPPPPALPLGCCAFFGVLPLFSDTPRFLGYPSLLLAAPPPPQLYLWVPVFVLGPPPFSGCSPFCWGAPFSSGEGLHRSLQGLPPPSGAPRPSSCIQHPTPRIRCRGTHHPLGARRCRCPQCFVTLRLTRPCGTQAAKQLLPAAPRGWHPACRPWGCFPTPRGCWYPL
ncbi:uncharacterized protein LOC119149083 isoform X2 [Falco rusticolus]|uniref:uncharacterized protein LOC119149083 isoform X1 n=1 Tax=Falco rusticolus TaxID=120794 RepID=UPI0018865AF7|nr:uncharacterized protein LOC119149083 isoform X1 [Falco rusticolus]XP_037245867.1 uncharacterized protein LOC119149083 isoform X2 [Falco rusticolus]